MPGNVGSQTVTLLYYSRADSGTINRRFVGIRKTGIYSGGYLKVVDLSHASISSLICEITDGTYQVRVTTSSLVTLAVSSATPYIVLRWTYSGSATNDYMALLAVASPNTNDLVVGLCTFTGGGDLQGFDYSNRSTPEVSDLFLKVEPTSDTELRVRVRAGRIQNGKEIIEIPDQKTSLFVPPSSNSKVYLVYVNRATGTISIDSSGTPAASPVAPNYGGKLVLAEVTLSSTATNIIESNIVDTRDFTNNSYDPDGVTLEINTSGKIALKDSGTPSSKLKRYDSGWFPVTVGTKYTKAHGLGAEPFMVQLWLSDSPFGVGLVLPAPHGRQYVYGMCVVDIDSTNIQIRGEQRIFEAVDSDGVYFSVTSGYARIKAI